MKADIDFENGTITLVCSKCRRKHLKQIADTKLGLQIKCECKNVISWQGDLTWVTCYARPYQWSGAAFSPQRQLNKVIIKPQLPAEPNRDPNDRTEI